MKQSINLSKKLLCAIFVFSFTLQSIAFVDSIGKMAFGAISFHASASSSLSTKHSELLYYHPDHLGSSSVLTDSSGDVVQRVQYYPYGDTMHEYGVMSDEQRVTSYLYTGQDFDDETAIYYYGARYYDPVLAKFVSVDPVINYLIPQDINLFSYAWNNPLRVIDPSGFDEVPQDYLETIRQYTNYLTEELEAIKRQIHILEEQRFKKLTKLEEDINFYFQEVFRLRSEVDELEINGREMTEEYRSLSSELEEKGNRIRNKILERDQLKEELNSKLRSLRSKRGSLSKKLNSVYSNPKDAYKTAKKIVDKLGLGKNAVRAAKTAGKFVPCVSLYCAAESYREGDYVGGFLNLGGEAPCIGPVCDILSIGWENREFLLQGFINAELNKDKYRDFGWRWERR